MLRIRFFEAAKTALQIAPIIGAMPRSPDLGVHRQLLSALALQ
jgi:hypothetical protein